MLATLSDASAVPAGTFESARFLSALTSMPFVPIAGITAWLPATRRLV